MSDCAYGYAYCDGEVLVWQTATEFVGEASVWTVNAQTLKLQRRSQPKCVAPLLARNSSVISWNRPLRVRVSETACGSASGPPKMRLVPKAAGLIEVLPTTVRSSPR
eukprot:CAMPEP_0115130520 /NCGR_PEP_ID=MMETSP0227-20121206/52520_1 /TAXON_ID=89957 /ORGANISM="Polarella glacialis, Strain CCMP 1383" /LENGTH=106 /DNA_ID=CAMNT_0002535765 /DNA_START=52 /DNA_END=373 /DNA_ORIENTATION=+